MSPETPVELDDATKERMDMLAQAIRYSRMKSRKECGRESYTDNEARVIAEAVASTIGNDTSARLQRSTAGELAEWVELDAEDLIEPLQNLKMAADTMQLVHNSPEVNSFAEIVRQMEELRVKLDKTLHKLSLMKGDSKLPLHPNRQSPAGNFGTLITHPNCYKDDEFVLAALVGLMSSQKQEYLKQLLSELGINDFTPLNPNQASCDD